MMDIFKRECDMKIEELTKERDQLCARVAELEGVLRVIKEPEDDATWLLRDHALNRTSRQPLAKVKAEAETLREYAEKFFGNSHITSDIKAKRKMLKEADRIEKEANDE